jgi:hypothetical protein
MMCLFRILGLDRRTALALQGLIGNIGGAGIIPQGLQALFIS